MNPLQVVSQLSDNTKDLWVLVAAVASHAAVTCQNSYATSANMTTPMSNFSPPSDAFVEVDATVKGAAVDVEVVEEVVGPAVTVAEISPFVIPSMLGIALIAVTTETFNADCESESCVVTVLASTPPGGVITKFATTEPA